MPTDARSTADTRELDVLFADIQSVSADDEEEDLDAE